MADRIDCAMFDELAAELALELLDAPHRDAVMRHVAGCARCHAELDALTGVSDRLVILAASAEPPLGFEQRVVQRLQPKRRAASWLAVAAVLLAVIAVGLGVLIGRAQDDPRLAALDQVDVDHARAGTLRAGDGADRGDVLATAGRRSLLTMTLRDLPRGEYHCLVRTDDGVVTEIAAWPIGDSGWGAWTVAVRWELDDIDAVLITDTAGRTVASTTFD